MKIEIKLNRLCLIILAVLILAPSSLSAQIKQDKDKLNYELAKQYIGEEKYTEASSLLEDLIDKEFRDDYYNALTVCYKQLQESKKQEKLIKIAIKKGKTNTSIYYIDYGMFYLSKSDSTKADKMFLKAIDNLSANNTEIYLCAAHFNKNLLYDYTYKTYIKGRELLKQKTKYTYEIGYILQLQSKYDEVINEYIVLLEDNPNFLSQAEVNINNLLNSDKDKKLLSTLHNTLLEKVKANPKNEQLARLYLWTLIKEENYSLGFVQAKALDNRFDANSGNTLISFGEIAMNNEQYDIAVKTFDLLIKKGEEDNAFYEESLINRMNCLYIPFTRKTSHTEKEKKALHSEFEKTLSILGKNSKSAAIMQEYALFLAYYEHLSQEAIDILDTIVNMNTLSLKQRSLAKIDRGDIYLMEGDVWAASLEYSQVSKDLKNENEGSMAKFKNAMLSYYTGDFEWALSQFSTLRSSTSKLIANDAMEYSLLIKENMDEDSSYNALSYFAKADFLLFQNKYEEAKKNLEIIETSYISHAIFDEVLYKKGQIAYKEKKYAEADSLWNNLLLKYPYDIVADDALFSLAQMYENVFQDKEKALEYYQRIIIDYPSSLYVSQCRKKNEQIQSKKEKFPHSL